MIIKFDFNSKCRNVIKKYEREELDEGQALDRIKSIEKKAREIYHDDLNIVDKDIDKYYDELMRLCGIQSNK